MLDLSFNAFLLYPDWPYYKEVLLVGLQENWVQSNDLWLFSSSSLQLLRVRRGSVHLLTSTSSLMSRVSLVIGFCHGRTTPSCAARAEAATVSGRKPMTVKFTWSNKVNTHVLLLLITDSYSSIYVICVLFCSDLLTVINIWSQAAGLTLATSRIAMTTVAWWQTRHHRSRMARIVSAAAAQTCATWTSLKTGCPVPLVPPYVSFFFHAISHFFTAHKASSKSPSDLNNQLI